MCGTILIFLTIRLLMKGEIQEAYQKTKNSKYILIFCGLSTIVSVLYQNWIGAFCSVAIAFVLSFILYYRMHIDKKLFEFITDVIVVLSFFAAIYGFIEYIGILEKFGYEQFELIFFNKPKDRINSFYFNANYYAMMIEFFVLITFYKLLQIKHIWKNFQHVCKLLTIIGLNLLALMLTACRTAWPALAAGILVILILDKRYKACTFIFFGFICAMIYFLANPSQFPRVDNIISYFLTRTDIWDVAIANIKTHPLFGEGPMTYMHIYQKYNGHPTQHAHSVYLDPLLCFGVVGLSTIVPYVYSNIKYLYRLWKTKVNKTLTALIVSFTIVVLVHGTMDYTIFFVQTGVLYLIIASSFDIYKDDIKRYEN